MPVYVSPIDYSGATSPTMLTLVKIGGIDVTSHIKTYALDKAFGDATHQITITAPQPINDLIALDNGLRLEVWRGWYADTDQKIFDGTILSHQSEGGTQIIVGQDKMGQLVTGEVSHLFDSSVDLSAGKISEIARDIIESYGNLYAGPYDITVNTIAVYPLQSALLVYDFSGNEINAASAIAVTGVAGKYGNALSFDGATSEILFGTPVQLNLTGQIAVEAWVNLTTAVQAGTIAANSKAGGGSNSGWVLGVDASGRPFFTVADASTTATALSANALSTGTWYHVAGTFDGVTVRVYVENALKAETYFETTPAYAGCGFCIGSLAGAVFFKGKIDEVRISDFAWQDFSYTDSVVDSGGTNLLAKFPCVHVDPLDPLKTLADTLDYQLYYKADVGKVVFEPKGYYVNASIVYVGGSNANVVKVPQWSFDSTQLANNITVQGGNTQAQTEKSFAGPATSVTLNYKPVSAKVTVGGVLKEGGGTDTSGNPLKDYAIDYEGMKINFKASSSTIVVDYSYIVPNVLNGSVGDGKAKATFAYPDIVTVPDLQKKLDSLIAKYSAPFSYATIRLKGSELKTLDVGQLVNVVDSVNGVTGQYVINRYTITYPGAYDDISVGDKEWRTAEWGAQVEEKIKQLQSQLNPNASQTTQTLTGGSVNRLRRKQLIVATRSINASFVWDNSTNGAWDAAQMWDVDTSGSWTEVVNTTYY